MVERIVELTSNSSNVHEVVYDNSNSYKNEVIDAIRMNQGHTSQCPIINKCRRDQIFLSFKRF
jgi:hypothetical protein